MLYTDPVTRYSGLSWDDFKRHLANCLDLPRTQPAVGRFVFRGQQSSDWGLLSGFDRLTKALDAPSRTRLYASHVTAFRASVERKGLLSTENYFRFSRQDDLAIEMIGQHHGLPTRLLDWSLSPFVAAFFAFADARWESAPFVSIWAMNRESLNSQIEQSNCEIIDDAPTGVLRLEAQSGVFTKNNSVFPDLVDLAKNCSGSRTLKNPILICFTINSKERDIAMSELALMGISHERLFPGIDGISKKFRDDLINNL